MNKQERFEFIRTIVVGIVIIIFVTFAAVTFIPSVHQCTCITGAK